MLAKSLSFLAGADAAGIVLGARVPIILTSRADSLLTRLASCAVAALVAAARRTGAAPPSLEGTAMSETIRPVLAGQKALVVGVANDQSIAYGCAKAFRDRRRRPRHHLAERAGRGPMSSRWREELEAPITAPLDVVGPGPAGGGVRSDPDAVGPARHPGALDRLCAEGRPAGRAAELLGRGLRQGDGHLLPFLRPHGEAGGAADDRRRHDVRDELLRRQPGGAELQRHGTGEGGAGGGLPLPGLRAGAAAASACTRSRPGR